MKKSYLATLALVVGITGSALAQTHRNCGTMDHLNEQFAADPGLEQRMQQIESATQSWISDPSHRTGAVITIPVVVHVVYSSTAQNISDAQIQSQIAVLNADFRKLNADVSLTPSVFASLATDCQIQFCLAQRDPNGNATTGIVRKATTTTSFSTNDNVKRTANGGDNAWNSSQYLNLWSANLSGGVLGYAQFPGGTASTDGVVILYSAFGNSGSANAPYNLGRTATHEVGHWLNLRHIWGDASCGNDQVTDTPTSSTSNFGCPAFPHVTCSNGPNGDMFMNYMDYTDDACMYMFTVGQSARMSASINTSRTGLLTSLGCQAPTGGTCGTAASLTATSITQTTATLSWSAVSGASSYSVQYRAVGTTTWSAGTSATTSLAVSGLTASTAYEFQVTATCSATVGTTSTIGTFTTSAVVTSCGTPATVTSSAITSTTATLSWGAVSGVSSYSVKYRIVGAATWLTGTSTTASLNVTGLTAASNYQFQVTATCSAIVGTTSALGTFTTSAATTTCTDSYEANESRTAAKTIAVNTDIYAKIGTSTDKDWFKITTVATAPKVKVVLDQLVADYDLALYNSAGTTLTSSALASTATETVKYNTSTTAATYYIQVYGYGGAFNATSCYHLKVSTSATNWKVMADETDVNSQATIEKMNSLDQLLLFPNPASTALTINFFTPNQGTSSIEVYDMIGKVVATKTINSLEGFNAQDFDITSLSNGVYFLKMTQSEKSIVKKFVVKH